MMIVGSRDSSEGDITGYHKDTSRFLGYGDAYVVHLSPTGTILWQKCYGGSSWDWGASIISTKDGGYLFIGTTDSRDGDLSIVRNKTNYYDGLWIVKINSIGNIEWQQCYGGTQEDDGISVLQTKDGKILFAGYTRSVDGDVEGAHYDGVSNYNNKGDIWVVKLGITAGVTSSDDGKTILLGNRIANIYPNPASKNIHLQLESSYTLQSVELYDMLGARLSCETNLDANTATINVESLPNGTYIARGSYRNASSMGTLTLPFIVYH